MAITTVFYLPNSLFSHKPIKAISFSTPKSQIHEPFQTQVQTRKENPADYVTILNRKAAVALFGAGLSLSLIAPASAAELPFLGSTLQLVEPANALSLPTWAIHVSSVVEWITAMALVWQYGEQSGYESWKGLAWGMELVALQAALTVIGNATMCIAAFRIYKASEESSKNL